jgi:hypothetical protein
MLVYQFANLKMAIDIVDLPVDSMVIFQNYVNVYRRVIAEPTILNYQ